MINSYSTLLGFLLCGSMFVTGCEGVKEHVRSKDYRQPGQPAYRPTGTPSPIADVADMPGWTSELDSAIAFATENPQNTVVFFQQSGNPQSESTKKLLIDTPEETFADKQRVTVNMAVNPDVAARFGVRQAPAVVMLGPGGVPAKQLNGRVTNDQLKTFLK